MFFRILELECSLKLVNRIIREFTSDFTIKTIQRILTWKVRINIFVSRLDLQVSFSVQVLSFHIAHSLRKACAQKQKVTRHWVVLLNLDDIPHFDLSPFLDHKCFLLMVINECRGFVFNLVVLNSFVVFKSVFDHRHYHH
jgi:hypothetical protein